jgi:hypothetical protein
VAEPQVSVVMGIVAAEEARWMPEFAPNHPRVSAEGFTVGAGMMGLTFPGLETVARFGIPSVPEKPKAYTRLAYEVVQRLSKYTAKRSKCTRDPVADRIGASSACIDSRTVELETE